MLNIFCVAVILSLLALAGFSGCNGLGYCLWEHMDGIAASMQHSLHCLGRIGTGQWVITFLVSFKPCCSDMSFCIFNPKTWSWRSRQCCCCYRTTSQQPVCGERQMREFCFTNLIFLFRAFFVFLLLLAMSCSIQNISVKIWTLTVHEHGFTYLNKPTNSRFPVCGHILPLWLVSSNISR